MATQPLERLVDQARSGSTRALEAVVRAIQDEIYRMALKMLWHPADAEDAAQEIILRVISHLDDFRGQSAFKTIVTSGKYNVFG